MIPIPDLPVSVPLSLASLALASALGAAPLSHESFSGYNTGKIQATHPGPAVPGYAGNWTPADFGDAQPVIITGSLIYRDAGYLGSVGDKVGVPARDPGNPIHAGNSGRVYRPLDSSLAVTNATTGTLYLSFLFQSGQETGATTYQTLALYDGGTADAARNFDAGLTDNDGETGAFYNFGVDDACISTGVAADTAVHLFVIKFELGDTPASDSVTVWIDPVIPPSGDPVAGGTTVTGKDITFDRLALSDYDGNSAAWDEIRWGATFADVAGAARIRR